MALMMGGPWSSQEAGTLPLKLPLPLGGGGASGGGGAAGRSPGDSGGWEGAVRFAGTAWKGAWETVAQGCSLLPECMCVQHPGSQN